MKKFFQRSISIILSFALLAAILPTQVFAENIDSVRRETKSLTQSDSAGFTEAIRIETQSSDFEFSSLSGTVVDNSGRPLSGVSVSIFNIDESVLLSLCETNSSGTWATVEYDAIAGYTYIVNYYKVGYQFSDNNIRCTAASGGTVLPTVTAAELSVGDLICNEADYTYTVDTVAETASITGYTGSDSAIMLPDRLGGYPVTSIGENAFKGMIFIKTLWCPKSLTSIGDYAFSGCSGLSKVYFPSTLRSIGSYAFTRCSGLTDLVFPNSLKSIGSYAFNYCSQLTAADLPDSVTSIGYRAFYHCTSLSSFTYPKSWSSASSEIFTGCSALTSISIPEGVSAIPDNAFSGADCLKIISLPQSLSQIGDYAFSNCSALSTPVLPDGLTSIDSYAFSGCVKFESVVLPNALTTLGYRAFSGCTKLSSITYPLSLTSVGSEAFRNCSNLKSITVPEGVTKLPNHVFQGANCLRTVSLPASLTAIGESAFAAMYMTPRPASDFRASLLPPTASNTTTPKISGILPPPTKNMAPFGTRWNTARQTR